MSILGSYKILRRPVDVCAESIVICLCCSTCTIAVLEVRLPKITYFPSIRRTSEKQDVAGFQIMMEGYLVVDLRMDECNTLSESLQGFVDELIPSLFIR